jgi:hypothetical protein
VLLHGGGATSTVRFSTVGEPTQERRVYAIDQIGDPGPACTTVRDQRRSDYMSWLDSTLDGLRVASERLAGANYALHAQNRAQRLVLLAPTACFSGMCCRNPDMCATRTGRPLDPAGAAEAGVGADGVIRCVRKRRRAEAVEIPSARDHGACDATAVQDLRPTLPGVGQRVRSTRTASATVTTASGPPMKTSR